MTLRKNGGLQALIFDFTNTRSVSTFHRTATRTKPV
jgi:hypothetical protein